MSYQAAAAFDSLIITHKNLFSGPQLAPRPHSVTDVAATDTKVVIVTAACACTGGRMTGQIIRAIVRHSGSTLPVSLSSYAVVGAAAFMGGATRLTLTATVMVMETTGSLQLIVPLMLTVFVAKV